MTIAEGLRSVARDLDADPRVLVFAWVEPRQGVTEDALVAAEQRLGATLPEGLRALYRAMNGFGLAWVDEEGFEALRSTLGELLRRFVVLDRFSASEQAFLYVGPGPRHLRVHRMANDFELDDADPHLDLEDYFSGVVATRGRRDGRRAMFSRDE